MSPNSRQSAKDSRQYVPPHIQQAMSQHLQQSMPAHLKKYVGQNAAYVPQHAQAQIAQAMQKNMPAHLKQYAGAYMQQQIVQPNTTRLHGPVVGQDPMPHAPTPDRLRRDHSMYGEQHSVDPATLPANQLFQPDNQAAAGQTPPPTPAGPHPPEYDFIMNPSQPAPRQPVLTGRSTAVKATLVGGGLLALMIIFAIAKSLLGGHTDLTGYLAVAEDQQALLHLINTTSQQSQNGLSADNQNFAMTAQLSLGTAQADLITYLNKNGHKVSTKQLNHRVSLALDTQLSGAAQAGTYNQSFSQIMQAKLSNYQADLQQAYRQSAGPKGRALLSNQYTQSQLLLTELNASH